MITNWVWTEDEVISYKEKFIETKVKKLKKLKELRLLADKKVYSHSQEENQKKVVSLLKKI